MPTPDNLQPGPADLAELDSLSPSNRQLLQSMVEALGELHPQPGTLHDLPQVTVNADELDKACRIAKDSPLLNANQLMCLACVDYQEKFSARIFPAFTGRQREARPHHGNQGRCSLRPSSGPVGGFGLAGGQSGTSGKPTIYSE